MITLFNSKCLQVIIFYCVAKIVKGPLLLRCVCVCADLMWICFPLFQRFVPQWPAVHYSHEVHCGPDTDAKPQGRSHLLLCVCVMMRERWVCEGLSQVGVRIPQGLCVTMVTAVLIWPHYAWLKPWVPAVIGFLWPLLAGLCSASLRTLPSSFPPLTPCFLTNPHLCPISLPTPQDVLLLLSPLSLPFISLLLWPLPSVPAWY